MDHLLPQVPGSTKKKPLSADLEKTFTEAANGQARGKVWYANKVRIFFRNWVAWQHAKAAKVSAKSCL
jgi:hypothetical protein